MGDQQHRGSGAPLHRRELIEQLRLDRGIVERRSDLVADQQVGFRGEGARDRDTLLLLAAGDWPREAPEQRCVEPEVIEQSCRPRFRRAAIEAMEQPAAAGSPARPTRRRGLSEESGSWNTIWMQTALVDAARGRMAGKRRAVEAQRAFLRRQQPADRPPSVVLPEPDSPITIRAEHLATAEREADPAQGWRPRRPAPEQRRPCIAGTEAHRHRAAVRPTVRAAPRRPDPPAEPSQAAAGYTPPAARRRHDPPGRPPRPARAASPAPGRRCPPRH